MFLVCKLSSYDLFLNVELLLGGVDCFDLAWADNMRLCQLCFLPGNLMQIPRQLVDHLLQL